MMRVPLRRWFGRVWLVPLLALCSGLAPANADATAPRPPLVGFSFTPNAARYGNLDPEGALAALLDRLDPDLVRLPVYWQDVAPSPSRLDFEATDRLLSLVRVHNRVAGRPTRVILVEGARNLGFPELFVPGWVTAADQRDVPGVLRTDAYQRYMVATLMRYRTEPLLFSWQIENEPFDNVVSGAPGAVRVPSETVAIEVARARQLDPAHPAVVTSYNSATVDLDEMSISPFARLYRNSPVAHPTGHPQAALDAGDVLGLDVYVSTPSTAPADAVASDATPDLAVATRIRWKKDVLDYWSERARSGGKRMWVMEMQGGSWRGDNSFTRLNLIQSATEYSDGSAEVVLLWGVESWLTDPAWMSTGLTAMHVLRGADPDHGAAV